MTGHEDAEEVRDMGDLSNPGQPGNKNAITQGHEANFETRNIAGATVDVWTRPGALRSRTVVAVYACETYGQEPAELDAEDAREMAQALIEAADHLDRLGATE